MLEQLCFNKVLDLMMYLESDVKEPCERKAKNQLIILHLRMQLRANRLLLVCWIIDFMWTTFNEI